jgi:hypothetical protein
MVDEATSVVFRDRFSSDGRTNDPYEVRIVQNNETARGDSKRQGIQIKGWLPEEVTFDISSQYEAPYAQGFNQAFPVVGQLARALGVNLVNQAMTLQVWQGSAEINFQLPIIFQAVSSAYTDVMVPIKELLKLTMPRDPQGGGLLESPGPRINVDRLNTSLNSVVETIPPDYKGTADKARGTAFQDITRETLLKPIDTIASGLNSLTKSATEAMSSLESVSPTSVIKLGANVAGGLNKAFTASSRAINAALVNAIDNNISLYIGDFMFLNSVVVTDVSQAYNILIAPDNRPSRATVNVTFKMFFIPTQEDLDQMFPQGLGPSGTIQQTVVFDDGF